MIKCVIFDMDGTLADTLPLCLAAFRSSIEKYTNKFFSDEEIIATFGPSEEGTIQALMPERYEEGVAGYLYAYDQLHDEMAKAPFPGMKEVLDKLKRKGIALGLVTGKGRASLDITLKKFGMTETFGAIRCGKITGGHKDEHIKEVLEELGYAPSEAVYIGDAPSDVVASRVAGVPIIGVTWAGTTDEKALAAQKPEAMCERIEDLYESIMNLERRV